MPEAVDAAKGIIPPVDNSSINEASVDYIINNITRSLRILLFEALCVTKSLVPVPGRVCASRGWLVASKSYVADSWLYS